MLFGSAVRSPSSIIWPKRGTSERRVEFVVDAPFLAGDFEGFAEDSFGLRLVDIWHLLDLDFSGVCYGAIIPDEREAHPVIASILLCQRLHHFRGARMGLRQHRYGHGTAGADGPADCAIHEIGRAHV